MNHESPVIVRAPVRISFGGGGTDLEAYYAKFGGAVLSTAINKYIYAVLTKTVVNGIQIFSPNYGTFLREPVDSHLSWGKDFALPRAVLRHFGVDSGIEILLASEIPPGTGLGSSSSVAVAMVKGMSIFLGERLSTTEVADLACSMEIERLGMPIGKQDQYASAFGGLNFMTFTRCGVSIEPLSLSLEIWQCLEKNLLLFFTGISRDSSSILHSQREESGRGGSVTNTLHELKTLAHDMRTALLDGDLDGFGALLDAAWNCKKGLSDKITNTLIDTGYAAARELGALGGKVSGAGGGGFLIIYAHEEDHLTITGALQALGLQRMDFVFDWDGVSVVSRSGLHDVAGDGASGRPCAPISEFWSGRAVGYQHLEWARCRGYLRAFITAGDFQPTDWVLDVGTGTGIVAHAVSPLVAEVVGVDVSVEMLARAQASRMANEVFEKGDMHRLRFSDNQFDKVMARMSFHHLTSGSGQAMRECYRVLKPGGVMIFSEGVPPNRSLGDWYTRMFALKEERLTLFEEDLVTLMSSGGFDVEQVLTCVSPQVSIGNWLWNSGLPQEQQDRIMQMHLDLDEAGKQHYNMRVVDDDVLCDFKYVILVGRKLAVGES